MILNNLPKYSDRHRPGSAPSVNNPTLVFRLVISEPLFPHARSVARGPPLIPANPVPIEPRLSVTIELVVDLAIAQKMNPAPIRRPKAQVPFAPVAAVYA